MRMQEAARRTGEVEQAAAESAEASVAETGQHAATVRLYVVLCMLRFLCDIYIYMLAPGTRVSNCYYYSVLCMQTVMII